MTMPRSLLATAATAAAMAGVLPLHPALAQKAGPVFVNGMAQVVPAFQDSTAWIRQDSGSRRTSTRTATASDRVHVDVTRPRQTETEGLKVPFSTERARTTRARPAARSTGTCSRSSNAASAAAREDGNPAYQRESHAHLERARERVGAARIRGRALGGARHRSLAGMPDGRRRSRSVCRRSSSSTGSTGARRASRRRQAPRRSGRRRGRPARSA